jgi:exopolyphosphatase / guanosine-5'-triphosphate,3'-diphosphate pyrophosphatase
VRVAAGEMKVSVIDLGFNSVKLVNYDIKKDGSFKAYQQEGVKVKLGEGLQETGYLGKEQVDRTIDALCMFRDIINFDSIRHVLPVATSAVREAGNKRDFLKQVFSQTGFQFKVLSGQEEGLYSYVGAVQATCTPTTLFFDLGGGSLELVYTENYSIKKIKSYPLGALRLTQMFCRKAGTFSRKDYTKMAKHILEVLPDRKELDLSPDTTLVGVGGTLRAMARYDQEQMNYELDKIHNYQMDASSVSSIAEELYEMGANELEEVKAIGSNRVDTITAGAAIIDTLVQKFGFERIVVSAEGLREGILSVFVRDPKTFYSGGISNEKAKAFVTFACQAEMLPQHTVTLVRPLVANGMLREKEKMILTHAIKQAEDLPMITNLNNLFYMMIDEDSAFLSHREQLILALSIVHTRKAKAADWLFSRYRSILEPQNKRSIEKISACLVLSAILERAKANARLFIKGKKVDIKIMPQPRQFVPSTLLENAIKNFERAFNVSVKCSVEQAALAKIKEKIKA